MCMGGSGPKATVQEPTPRYAPPRSPEVEAEAAKNSETLRRRVAAGFSGTLLTGPQGVTAPASTTGKTLLGG